MTIISKVIGLLLAASATSSFATVYSTAKFVPVDNSTSRYELLGFGRVTQPQSVQPSSFGPGGPDAARESFFDTWNIDVTAMLPGTYSFSTVLDAVNSLEFSFVDLFSYDRGARTHLAFDISPDGKHATATGTFVVENPCPVNVCVWLDIRGTQDKGSLTADYGGKFPAVAVPEPETYALMLAGLAGLALVTRRRVRSPG